VYQWRVLYIITAYIGLPLYVETWVLANLSCVLFIAVYLHVDFDLILLARPTGESTKRCYFTPTSSFSLLTEIPGLWLAAEAFIHLELPLRRVYVPFFEC
jgi:hypothetical protein